MISQLAVVMEAQAGVANTAQAEKVGVNRAMRRRLMTSGVLLQVRHGIYTTGERWDAEDHRGRHRIALAGALLARGWSPTASVHRHVGGLRTAAFLHGLPVQPDADVLAAMYNESDPRRLSPEARALCDEVARIRRGEGPRLIDLVSADRRRTYAHGVNVRPASLPQEHVVLNGGVPTTSRARTTADLMRVGTAGDAVIAADGALHAGLPHAELERAVRFCSRWANGVQALKALEFANGLAESPAESLARWVCAQEEKLPAPELQVEIYDRFGRIGRVDLLFRHFRVILEVDGLIKYTDPWCGNAEEALRLEHEREARLRAAGWTVVRTTWDELVSNPSGLIHRLLAELAVAR